MDAEILILGGNHQNPLGIVEALGRKGLKSNVIIHSDHKSSFVLKSKYVKRGWILKSREEIISCIIENFNDYTSKAVAYACNDDMACILGDNYETLKDILFLPVIPGNGNMRRWMNKEFQGDIARSVGLITPEEWLITNGQIPSDIVYPCITKSLTSVGKGKSEFSLCNNREELQKFFGSHPGNNEIQVQRFIDKEFEYQFLGLSLNGDEEIIIPGRTQIEHTSHFNNLVFLKYQQDTLVKGHDLLPEVKKLIKRSGFSGLFSAEFIHGKDGKDYFLEVNFRNDGNGIVTTASGTNLPYIWYLYCTGGDFKNELEKSTVADTYLMPEDSQFMLMLEGDISYRTWRENLRKTTCFLTYFKDDKAPFRALLWLQKKPLAILTAKYLLRKLHIVRR